MPVRCHDMPMDFTTPIYTAYSSEPPSHRSSRCNAHTSLYMLRCPMHDVVIAHCPVHTHLVPVSSAAPNTFSWSLTGEAFSAPTSMAQSLPVRHPDSALYLTVRYSSKQLSLGDRLGTW